MTNNVIIINTCDAYNDVWELFFKAFDEYWPRCEYPIILNTEKIKNLPHGIANKNITIHNFKTLLYHLCSEKDCKCRFEFLPLP